MAKQSTKDQGLWDRFILWTHENQKVIWVVLLVIIAPTFAMTGPFTQFFSPSGGPESAPYAEIYGRTYTQGEVRRTQDQLVQAHRILQSLFLASSGEPLPGAFGAGSGRFAYQPVEAVELFELREKAKRMGIRVSDGELGEVIRDIWQRVEALDRARAEIALANPQGMNPNDFSRITQLMELSKKKLADLRGGDGKYFDEAKWVAMIEGTNPGQKRASVREFQEILRDLLVVAKLESYVQGTVQVTPQEVYDQYKQDYQSRKLSWLELKIPDAIREKLEKSLTQDELKAHFALNKASFQKEATVRTTWLLVPEEQFKADAEKLVTEQDLKTYYEDNRNDYRKPAVLAAESEFTLRKPEEKAALDAQLYKPFEEVRDKVREKVIESRGKTELSAFTEKLRLRMYPPKPGDAAKTASDHPAVSFAELAKEFPFLRTGTTPFVEKAKAKEVFGDAYSSGVDGWFNAIQSKRPITAPKSAFPCDKGRVFYTKPDTRAAGLTPSLTDVEGEVRTHLAKKRILDEVEKALEAVSRSVNEAGKGDLAGVTGVEITVAGEKVRIEAGALQSSSTFIAQAAQQGRIMVPKKDPEKKPEEKPGDPAALPDPSIEPADEEHPASRPILEALYKLPEADKLKTVVATDPEQGAAYLIRYDDLKLPDPGKFEDKKSMLEQQVRRKAVKLSWDEWRRNVKKESVPSTSG